MRRVLLVGWGAVGDTVHAIPAIAALRTHLGRDGEIWVESFLTSRGGVAPHETAAPHILAPLGLVDRIGHRVVPGGRLGIALIEALVWRAVLGRRFDHIVMLMPFAAQPALLTLAARWSRRVCLMADPATGAAPADDRPLCWHLLETLRRQRIAEVPAAASAAPFLVPPEAAVRESAAWLERHRRHPDRRLVAIAPDASYPANRWPTERFVALAQALEASGEHEVVLCGGTNAVVTCREIAARCPEVLVSAGELSILGAAALFRQCAAFIGLDTGTTHLAAACGVRYVAIYGQRGTGRWYYPPCPTGVVLQRDVPCRQCWLTHCDQPGHPCLAGIDVEDVLDALRAVI